MQLLESTDYVCALRWKKGEYEGLWALDEPVKDNLAPHIILPALSARDIEKDRPLSEEEMGELQATRIAKYWGKRPCLLDGRFIKLGVEPQSDGRRFGEFLDRTSALGCRAIPVFDLATGSRRIEVIRDYRRKHNSCVAIRVTLSDLANADLQTTLHARLLSVVAKPHECLVILDLSEAETSDPSLFAEFVAEWVL